MTLVTKINVLFVTSALILSCLVTGLFAQGEYQATLNEVVDETLATMRSRPDLQLHVNQQKKTGLQALLGEFLQPRSVAAAVLYSNEGKPIANRVRSGATADTLPSLERTRPRYAVSETGLEALDAQHKPTGSGFWSSFTAKNSLIHLTTPVLSTVGWKNTDIITATDFLEALAQPASNDSLLVIAYLHIGIDPKVLRQEITPAISGVFWTCISLSAVLAIVVLLLSRRITAPLSQLKQLAKTVTAGEAGEVVKLKADDELAGIATALNNVLEGVVSHQENVGLEHRLLALKADQSASQLSAKDQELNKVTQEVSATKQQLHQLANYDRLTSLPNRNLFTEQLGLLLRMCSRDSKPVALLFMSLENFSRINESLGPTIADGLLQEVGNRLVTSLRNSDMLAHYVDSKGALNVSRFGGDEFAMVLNQLDNTDSAGLISQRLVDRIVEPISIDGHELVVSPRIGIAIAPRDGLEVDALLRAANAAMHHARAAGNHGFLFYNDGMEATGLDEFRLEADLRKAIEHQELHLHYQPQVNTSDGSIICAEALLRWEHPQLGPISPFKFVPLAEKIGLIGVIGEWVLSEACRQMKDFLDQGLELPRMAINISPEQINPSFIDSLNAVLEETGLEPSMLELGLSEGVLMENDSSTAIFLQELKEIGVWLSLENFGTGYAPLNYLSRYPLDELKLDRSFVVHCDKRKDAARLLQAIIAMARSLNLRTVAEGVETEGEYSFLAQEGVRIMKGYLFSKPIPAEELRKLLSEPWCYMPQMQRINQKKTLANDSTASQTPR